PDLQELRVDLGSGVGRFDAQRIAVVVASVGRGRAEVNNGVVAAQLALASRTDRRPEAFRTGPVRSAIDRAAVAEHDRSIVACSKTLQLALNEEDRPLRAPPPVERTGP